MFWLLLIAVIVFVSYAVFTQYQATEAGKPILKRVVAAIGLAAAAIGAAIMAWLKGVGG